jgi:hypothetical protein
LVKPSIGEAKVSSLVKTDNEKTYWDSILSTQKKFILKDLNCNEKIEIYPKWLSFYNSPIYIFVSYDQSFSGAKCRISWNSSSMSQKLLHLLLDLTKICLKSFNNPNK